MTEWIRRCKNCGNSDIPYKYEAGWEVCGHCNSGKVFEVEVKGNPSQRQAIRAGYDQVRPGLWLHFAAKRMIIHKYRGDCPWGVFVGEGSKGWLNMFSFQTLGDAVVEKRRKKANK